MLRSHSHNLIQTLRTPHRHNNMPRQQPTLRPLQSPNRGQATQIPVCTQHISQQTVRRILRKHVASSAKLRLLLARLALLLLLLLLHCRWRG